MDPWRELDAPALKQENVHLAAREVGVAIGYTRAMRAVKPDEADKLALLGRLREASRRAEQNLPRLLATLE